MIQEGKVKDKIEEVVTEDIWGSIKKFLDLGFHFGEDQNQIHRMSDVLLGQIRGDYRD